MKIGYPCINRGFTCRPSKTFRLASYSAARLQATVGGNLACLREILHYNLQHGLLFFRLASGLVPFASHPVCAFNWQAYFKNDFAALGRTARRHGMRISMHPDQFTLINSPDEGIFRRSARELEYHAVVLELMGLGRQAKIQIHAGGVYGDKRAAMARFVQRWRMLDERVRRHLVVENDDRLYTAADCLALQKETGIPVLFDVFHHALNNGGEPVRDALARCAATWRESDGLPMVDYSSQKEGGRRGAHADTLEPAAFRRFLDASAGIDCDIMLEIKDKETSAVRAAEIARHDPRFRLPGIAQDAKELV